jgi:hypothetical protein
MKKIIGYILAWSLIFVGVILASPFLAGLALIMLANKIQCWARGEHVYDYRLVLSGMHVSQLRCTRCSKPIVVDEQSSVLKQAEDFINALHQTKDFLNRVFITKTPEQQAVDDLLNETRGNSNEN